MAVPLAKFLAIRVHFDLTPYPFDHIVSFSGERRLSIPRLGFAVAMACTTAYVGCVFVIMIALHENAIKFLNRRMHGVDVTTITRWDMPIWETVLGTIETFVFG